jgi:hypothetical protein
VNKNRNRVLYFVSNNERGSVLNISVDPKNSDKLKNFYETLEEESDKKIEGEITYGLTYTSLKIFFNGDIKDYQESLISFITSIKNKN